MQPPPSDVCYSFPALTYQFLVPWKPKPAVSLGIKADASKYRDDLRQLRAESLELLLELHLRSGPPGLDQQDDSFRLLSSLFKLLLDLFMDSQFSSLAALAP